MEQKSISYKKDWRAIENIARGIIEDEMDIMSPKDLQTIEVELEKGHLISNEIHNGMAFDYATVVTIVSIAIIAISIVKDYYMVTRKPKISAEDVLQWVLETEGIIPASIPIRKDSPVAKFIIEHIDEINEKVIV